MYDVFMMHIAKSKIVVLCSVQFYCILTAILLLYLGFTLFLSNFEFLHVIL